MWGVDAGWTEVEHDARYHGQVDEPSGRSWWVFRRLHRAHGWCVETHADDPDGPLVDRRWFANSFSAHMEVGGRREAIATRGAAAAFPAGPSVDEPPPPGGLLVVHGVKNSRAPVMVLIDDGQSAAACSALWVTPGAHWVLSGVAARPADRQRRTAIVVGASSVVHMYSGLVVTRWGVEDPCPPWHRCRLRSLHFIDGLLAGHGDLRTLVR